jgi:hypothetical protein
MMEFLKAMEAKMETQIGSLERKMDSNQERTDANLKALKADQREMKAELKAWLGEMKACREATEACEGVTHACLEERKEPAPKETEVVAEPEEVPEGATDAETIGAAKDRSRDLHLAVGCRGRLKTRTKRDGRLRQECAATVRRLTRRFVPALRKGGLRKGPGKRRRRNGVRGPGETSGSRMEGRGLKQRRIKDNVVRGAPKERTRKVFENDIRDRSARMSIMRRNGRRVQEAFRHKFEPETAKLVVESPIGLQEPGDELLWKFRPPPKRKR